MSLNIYKKLGLKEPDETSIILQLANKSIKHPRIVVEYMLIKARLSN